MKKLVIATGAILAAALLSGGAFATPEYTAKKLSAPASALEVSSRCRRTPSYGCHAPCRGYYSLYTYVLPCNGGYGCWGCGHGGFTWTCGGFFGGIFGW